MDWNAWHEKYHLADSWMARRLQTVQARIGAALSLGVGVHRFAGTPQPLRRGDRLFEFVGYDMLREAATFESAAASGPRPHGQRQV